MEIKPVDWSPEIAALLAPAVENDPYLLDRLEDISSTPGAVIFAALDDGKAHAACLVTVRAFEAKLEAAGGSGVMPIGDFFSLIENACASIGLQSVVVETIRPGLAKFLRAANYAPAHVTFRKILNHGLIQ
jgi:hypothetical protein